MYTLSDLFVRVCWCMCECAFGACIQPKYEDQAPSFYIDMLASGISSITLPQLLGFKNTMAKAPTEWISTLIDMDVLTALESATSNYELPGV